MGNKKVKKSKLRLIPLSGGTIIVFNTIQQGMYKNVLSQIKNLENELKEKNIQVGIELFTVFGPFDNIIRFDIDDFCLVNRISSMAGVSSQQIQCAYPIWSTKKPGSSDNYWKPFCCLTQFKVQNHLMLGHGPEIEEGIAGLLAECMEEYLKEEPEITKDLEVELMATLGWDEFFIFMRNSRGYASMFKPILKKIRPLTLQNLEKKLNIKFSSTDMKLHEKHLFLSTYSTPGYCLELSQHIESKFEAMLKEKRRDGHPFIPGKEVVTDELFKDKYPDPDLLKNFGSDSISVSTRLSIKPGHWDKVSRITRSVLQGTKWWPKDPEKDAPTIDRIFSIGRYDVYPWLNTEMTCKEFVIYFDLLMFSLAGNLRREEEYKKFLTRTQYYNSFTIISYLEKDVPRPSDQDPLSDDKEESKIAKEGAFISQLEKLSLGQKEDKTILKVFKEREILQEWVPRSIVIGLSRIFSLFDSCIMDRFTCDSFLDMYPFMQRIREIIDTVEVDNEGCLFFKTRNSKGNCLHIELPESWGSDGSPDNPLVTVFYSAVERFYRGFVHRYLASYPMMDKNETGVDFSGRLHRLLSATTVMQNLLLDDLDCHDKKGFNSISTYPNIRIYRDSFNITECNVLHLLQVEMFYSIYHEIIHTFIHSKDKKGKDLLDTIELATECLPDDMPEESRDILRKILEELTGDLLLIKNAFYGDFKLFAFWYWLMLIQCKKKIDSQILLRFLLISNVMDEKSQGTIREYSTDEKELSITEPTQLINMMDKLLPEMYFPSHIKNSIISQVKWFTEKFIDTRLRRERFNYAFSALTEAFDAIYLKLDRLLERYCYPTHGSGVDGYRKRCFEAPLYPKVREDGENKKRQDASIQIFRCLLTFIYDHREKLLCKGDGILNFRPEYKEFRLKLFKYRVALINTLQWESLHWKKTLLETNGIDFYMQLKDSAGE